MIETEAAVPLLPASQVIPLLRLLRRSQNPIAELSREVTGFLTVSKTLDSISDRPPMRTLIPDVLTFFKPAMRGFARARVMTCTTRNGATRQ